MTSIPTAPALTALSGGEPDRDGPLTQRGYYITYMRMPPYDHADWLRIIDGIHDDGGNTQLLWVAGAFRSEKPIAMGSRGVARWDQR